MNPFDPHLWTKAGDLLLAAVLTKGFLLSALLIGGGLALRGLSAALRSAYWTAGALALLVLPLVMGRLPSWELGVVAFPTALFRSPAAETLGGGIAAEAGLPWIAWLAMFWLAGSAVLVGRFLVHLARVACATRRARPVPGHLADLAGSIAKDLGVRPARVALGGTPVPLTWGLWRPVILLPAEADRWPDGLQRAVLQHEMAHIRRRDYACLLGLELCRALHWPNPLAWHMLRRARMAQELACDDAAIRSGIAAPEYARHLVSVARTFARAPGAPVGVLPVLGVSPLVTRVEAALRSGVDRQPLTMRALVMAVALITAAAAPIVVADPWSCDEASTPPSPGTLATGPHPAVVSAANAVTGATRAATRIPRPLPPADCANS